MSAEAEKIRNEVSHNDEVERTEKRELDRSHDQDPANGINPNGDCKEENDGSFVFVTENDVVADDPAGGSIGGGVSADKEVEVVKEGENGAGEGQQDQSSGSNNILVEEAVGENVVESEAGKGGDAVNIEEEAQSLKGLRSAASEHGFLPDGDREVENGKASELESAQMGERRSDSQIVAGNPPDRETPEPAKGEEKIEIQKESDLSIHFEGNDDSEIALIEDAQADAEQGKQPVSPDLGWESVETVSGEIPLKNLSGEVGVSLEPSLQGSTPAADVQSESEVVHAPISDENGDIQVKSEAVEILASDENGDVPLESEAIKVPASDETGDASFISEDVMVAAAGGNGDLPSESEAVTVSVSGENSNLQSETEAVRISVSDEKDGNRLESEGVEILASGANDDAPLEPEAFKAPASDESGDVSLESEGARIPASDKNGDALVGSEGVMVAAADQNSGLPSESEVVTVPTSGENGNLHQLEPEAVKILVSEENDDAQLAAEAITPPACDENGNVQLEYETVQVPADNESGNSHLEPKAVMVSASADTGSVQLESETVAVLASDENKDDSAAVPSQDKCPGTVVMDEFVDSNLEAPQWNGSSGHAEGCSSSDQCETVSVENTESFASPEVKNKRAVLNDEPANEGLTEHVESDMRENSKEEPPLRSEPGVDDQGEEFVAVHGQEAVTESRTLDVPEASQSKAEEVKSLSPTEACEHVPVEGGKACLAPIDNTATGSESGTDTVKIIDNLTTAISNDAKTESEVMPSNAKHVQSVNSHTVENGEIQTHVKDGPTGNHAESSSLDDSCESGTPPTRIGCPTPVDDVVAGSDGKNKVIEVTENSAVGSEENHRMLSESATVDPECSQPTSESELLDGSEIKSEEGPTTNAVAEKGESDSEDKKGSWGVDGTDITQRDENLGASGEGSVADASEEHLTAEPEKKPFYYLIRVPRYDDDNLKERIKLAQLQVDEKTKSRDAIKAEILKMRESSNDHGDSFEAVIAEEKSARDILRSKRQEIDSLQCKIEVVKSATTLEDIESRVRKIENMIEHETLPLKEEKQLIREIKQLKQLREQISSHMGTQDEVQQALKQKDEVEERLKILRKETALLRENFSRAQANTKSARKKRYDESDKLAQLQEQFRAADAVRQEAYAYLQSLKKQLYEKNKHFYNYREEAKAANDLASKGDKEALQHLCVNQVERFMDLWNKDDEFRRDYIRCNIRSTLRRLRTLDGRALGPNEEPPVIPRAATERFEKHRAVSLVPPPVVEKHDRVLPMEEPKVEEDNKAATKAATEQKNQLVKSKKPVKPASLASSLATISGGEKLEEEVKEESKLTKEEEELEKRAEELRKQEGAARLKEQKRLEEIAKAKEALERKKRKEEKAKARAVLRAQKEAEEKDKEREKRLRKKERRKATAPPEDTTDATNEEQDHSSSSPESQTGPSKESDPAAAAAVTPRETAVPPTKRPHKQSQFTKQSKSKSIPPPLRNRGKRKIHQWMWLLVIALLVFALFLLGDGNFSLRSGLQVFGF